MDRARRHGRRSTPSRSIRHAVIPAVTDALPFVAAVVELPGHRRLPAGRQRRRLRARRRARSACRSRSTGTTCGKARRSRCSGCWSAVVRPPAGRSPTSCARTPARVRDALAFADGDAAADVARGRRAREPCRATRCGDAGVGRGDRVLWLGQNSFRLQELLLACCKIGAMFCPANWRQQPDELAFVIDDLAPAVVVWQEEEVGDTVRRGTRPRGASRRCWMRHDDDGPTATKRSPRPTARTIRTPTSAHDDAAAVDLHRRVRRAVRTRRCSRRAR